MEQKKIKPAERRTSHAAPDMQTLNSSTNMMTTGSENRMYRSLRKGVNSNSRVRPQKHASLAPLNETDAEEAKSMTETNHQTSSQPHFKPLENQTYQAPMLTPIMFVRQDENRSNESESPFIVMNEKMASLP